MDMRYTPFCLVVCAVCGVSSAVVSALKEPFIAHIECRLQPRHYDLQVFGQQR